MKIYTKTGDTGQTSLLSGKRVDKHHIRIESYGTVDELNAFVGNLRDQLDDSTVMEELTWVQNILFDIGSNLAMDEANSKIKLPQVKASLIERLEHSIDRMNEDLPEMRNFILPGGHPIVSSCHICRTVCRRAERSVSLLSQEAQVNEHILIFLNRLSDYLFVLSRKLAKDLKVEEIPWLADRD